MIAIVGSGIAERRKGDSTGRGGPLAVPKKVEVCVLIDNQPDAPLPWLTVALGEASRTDEQARNRSFLKPNKQGTEYRFIVPFSQASLEANPVLVFPNGKPRAISYEYESFFETEAVLHAEIGDQPVVIGILRVMKSPDVKIQTNRRAQLVASWPTIENAAYYTVSLYRWQEHGDMLGYSLFTCTRTKPGLSVRRLLLARAIVTRAKLVRQNLKLVRLNLVPPSSVDDATWDAATGNLQSARISVKMFVVARDANGRIVGELASDKINYEIRDPKELAELREEIKRKRGQ